MKRNILLSIVLVMITLGVSTSSGKINQNVGGIHYVVFVNNALANSGTLCEMLIAITDGNGNIVAGPKPYVKGASLYDFYEARVLVYGSRIARMGIMPLTKSVCPNTPVPSTKTGYFIAGHTYKYQLNLGNPTPFPISTPPNAE